VSRTIAHRFAAGIVLAALSGCATPSTTSASAGESPSATGQRAAAPAPVAGCTGELTGAVPPVEVATRLSDGRVDPAPQRVEVALGTPVVLRVEVDAPAEVHVHGYDRLAEATPGAPACLEIVADVPGVFDVEAHPDVLLVQLAVR
jgi:hypothetical protein